MKQRIRNILIEATAFTDRSNINEAFWNWFGKSKVVDSNGDPLVVYRGGVLNDGILPPQERGGFPNEIAYFSDRREYAEQYGQVEEFYLKITNPWNAHEEVDQGWVEELLPSVDASDWEWFSEHVSKSHGESSVSLMVGEGKVTIGRLALAFPKEMSSIFREWGCDGLYFEDLEGFGNTLVPIVSRLR